MVVTKKTQLKTNLPLWQRIAAFFSFVALASALLAPSALLAEEVRTGKLGGLCTITSVASGDQTDGDSADLPVHCDACAASGGVLPEGSKPSVVVAAKQTGVAAGLLLHLPAHIDGLPPSRGPPAI